jgi:hypothetical protein
MHQCRQVFAILALSAAVVSPGAILLATCKQDTVMPSSWDRHAQKDCETAKLIAHVPSRTMPTSMRPMASGTLWMISIVLH